MEGRRGPRVGAFLLLCAGLTGCSSTGAKSGPQLTKFPTPKPSEARASAAPLDAKRKVEPIKPGTLVAVGAVKDELAKNPDLSFAEAEQIRADARLQYQNAIAIDPKGTDGYLGLAKSYAAADDLPQCCAMYDKAIALKPKDANLVYEKGTVQARFKDWDGAIASFRQAQKIDPDNRQYGRMIGMIQARAGRFDEAEATLRRCMKDEEAHYTLARMHQHLNQTEACRHQCNLALKARPTFAPARDLMQSLEQGGGVQTVGYSQPAAPTGTISVDGIE